VHDQLSLPLDLAPATKRVRAPSEEPNGLLYRPEIISPRDEIALAEILDELRWEPIVLRGQTARRTARHFGLGYDYETRAPRPGEPLPAWLVPLRARAADLAGVDTADLVETLVQRYPPGAAIGWHRDAPAFGTVVGISLLGSCRMRFQRGSHEHRRVWEQLLAPRSGYVLDGDSRSAWEHSIAPTPQLRYSITFRTLRPSAARTSSQSAA
jgi:alkylated DNA repair dioxygenase AlkB